MPQVQKTGKRIAVVGAGPAGLACAHDLALDGHEVTVFESSPEPGGMLRYAIPEYRLPKAEVKKEIAFIERLGVAIRCGMEVGKDIGLDTLKEEHDALFIGTGAPSGLRLGVEGEHLRGVTDGLAFLRSVNAGEAGRTEGAVAVIGGGNTAIDCARTARRLGANSVTLVYRRTRDEMPAAREEIEAMLHEGIETEFLAAPVRFIGDGERVTSMELIRMKLGEPDKTGRRRPVAVEGSAFIVAVDIVITALGQAAQTTFASSLQLSLGKNGTIQVDNGTGATNVKGVFAGGDVASGPAYVVDAIAAGKKAAYSISRFLKGEPVDVGADEKKPEPLTDEQLGRLGGRIARAPRISIAEEQVNERIASFQEATLGYRPQEAAKEASRCLAGQVEGCIECGECERRCDVKAVDHRMRDEVVHMHFDGVILAPGFDLYDPSEKRELGYGRLPGVVTSIEFERISSVTGPTGGEIIWQGERPKRFFFIQCVGSRDRQSGARFCSRVCCMYTAKHASIVKERVKDAQVFVSYIDVRAYAKSYEEFYKSTQESGVLYIRGIPGEVVQGTKGLLVRVEDMLSGELLEQEVDLVILATGVRPRAESEELCRIMSVETDDYGFVKVESVASSRTNVEGIFVCGVASGPKDVPDTVASGGDAASRCMEYLSSRRATGWCP
jgi:heterodisulfide reductase subunit A